MKKLSKEIKSNGGKSVESQVQLHEELNDQILQGISAGVLPPKP